MLVLLQKTDRLDDSFKFIIKNSQIKGNHGTTPLQDCLDGNSFISKSFSYLNKRKKLNISYLCSRSEEFQY